MKQQVGNELLDRIQLHAVDRAAAEATLPRAEAIASAVYRGTLGVQNAVAFLRHGAQRVARVSPDAPSGVSGGARRSRRAGPRSKRAAPAIGKRVP